MARASVGLKRRAKRRWLLKLAASAILLLWAMIALLRGPISEPLPLLIGQGIVLLGGGINVVHYFILRRFLIDKSKSNNPVTNGGLYGLIRHPMYLGDLILMIGFSLIVGSLAYAIAVGVFLFLLLRLAEAEEAVLSAEYEDSYRRYQQETGMLFPRCF